MRWLPAAAAVLLGLLAGCGSSSDSGSKPAVTTVIQQQTVTAPPAASETSTSTPAPAPSSSASSGASDRVSVPNEVGERLDVAEDDLSSKGLTFQEIGGGVVGIVVKSNWTVCQTKPSAGTKVSSGASIKLIVDRSC
jgi:hypothetical protein